MQPTQPPAHTEAKNSDPTANALPDCLTNCLASGSTADEQNQPIPLDSNISLEEAWLLYHLIRHHRPTESLEIGFAHGISTTAILQALQHNQAGCHHVLDPYQNKFQNAGLALAHRAGLSHRLDFHPAFPEEVIPALPRVQFAFIDSSHLFDLTVTEFVLTDKKLEIDGLLVFHDMWMPSLQKLIRYVLNNRSYQIYTPPDAEPRSQPSNRSRLKRLLGQTIAALPGSRRIFREELLKPWSTICNSNMLILQKSAHDHRPWDSHNPF